MREIARVASELGYVEPSINNNVREGNTGVTPHQTAWKCPPAQRSGTSMQLTFSAQMKLTFGNSNNLAASSRDVRWNGNSGPGLYGQCELENLRGN